MGFSAGNERFLRSDACFDFANEIVQSHFRYLLGVSLVEPRGIEPLTS